MLLFASTPQAAMFETSPWEAWGQPGIKMKSTIKMKMSCSRPKAVNRYLKFTPVPMRTVFVPEGRTKATSGCTNA